ncbi:hypothetical protein PR048_027909 [Dryococelus australis]|uniref:ATP-dependent DNA helicase n=1 Tax=Dryococelus australis TaxID=614101 RepID=A0ABQ9GHU8_9NEOP|nr:hypothetical protein PR048_027909 [Dryococelus australis]
MSHKRAIEELNRSLQDIRGDRALMSGVVVALVGDFLQTLPFIEKKKKGGGTPADEMNCGSLWISYTSSPTGESTFITICLCLSAAGNWKRAPGNMCEG